MHVFGHRHVPNYCNFVLLPNLSQRPHKHVSGSHRPEQRKPPVTTARDEMQIAFSVVSFEVLWHPVDERSHVRPIVPTSCGRGPTACDLQQRRGPQISGDEHGAPSRCSTVTSRMLYCVGARPT